MLSLSSNYPRFNQFWYNSEKFVCFGMNIRDVLLKDITIIEANFKKNILHGLGSGEWALEI